MFNDNILPFNHNRRIRLIGADLDNTLLTRDKRLTDHTKKVLEKSMDQGVVFVPATGRARSGIPAYLKELKGIRYVLLANGAAVVDLESGEYVYRNGIPYEKALSMIADLEKYDTFYDFFAEGSGWCEGRFYDHLEDYRIDKHIIDLIRMSRKRIDSMEEWLKKRKCNVEKFTLFFADEDKRQQVISDLSADKDIRVTSSLPGNLELNHHSCNKGEALLALGRYLRIPGEEIMAFGDGDNDYDMVRMAGFGVAVKNAIPSLRRIADYIGPSCDDEGVAKTIETFVLGQTLC